ncbi:MAG TPA: hypothetical protein VGL59_04075, partial [Polyangia bacterium]
MRSLASRARGQVHGSLTLDNLPTVADTVVDVGGISRRQPPLQMDRTTAVAVLIRRNNFARR